MGRPRAWLEELESFLDQGSQLQPPVAPPAPTPAPPARPAVPSVASAGPLVLSMVEMVVTLSSGVGVYRLPEHSLQYGLSVSRGAAPGNEKHGAVPVLCNVEQLPHFLCKY